MKAQGRAVLVTGASRGIGRACAEAFASNGDRVAVHHRDSGVLAATVVASLPGEGHTSVQAELGDAEAVSRMVGRAAEALGGLDVLVNNAALYVPHPVAEVGYDEWQAAWRRTIDVNLIGTSNVTYLVARRMIAAGHGGRIVNVSSRGAFRGEPDHPAYGASKAGLNAFGQSMAQALAPFGIAVATVAPGYVETDMAKEYLDAHGDAIRAQSPFGRVARPEEVAAAVLYLASPAAEFATGAVLDLNGASYLRT
ncbi:MAG TPA: 3-oxoacyl-ACP reductase [Actinobacteria bacterium]|nr:3-oxoacyl-ACP reductase [Actinomycetota bacterium]